MVAKGIPQYFTKVKKKMFPNGPFCSVSMTLPMNDICFALANLFQLLKLFLNNISRLIKNLIPTLLYTECCYA